MRFLLALLTLSLALPAAAVPKGKTKKTAPTKPVVQDDFGSPTSRAPTSASSSRARVTTANVGPTKPVSIVPVVGLTVNSISGLEDWIKDAYKTSNYSTSPDTGFTVGALADIGVGLNSTLVETGFAYTQLNQKFSIEKRDQAFVLNYLSIPVQGKTYVMGGRSGLFVNYGLAGNFILGATAKGETSSTDIKDKMTSLNIMSAVGVGYALRLGSAAQGQANVAFNRSLNKINSEGDTSLYNNTISFNLGVIL